MDLADATPEAADVRQRALDALTELPNWHLPGDEWPAVARAVEDVAAAADLEALARAVTELEARSPFRIDPIDLSVPAPKSLRLRRAMLVRTLTGEDPPRPTPAPAPPALPALTAPAAAGAVKQELVVHAFAPLDGPWAEPAHQRIRRLWTDAARILATAAPLGTPGPDVDPPAEARAVPAGPLLAGRQRADGSVQMVLRREPDALVLSIAWLAGPGADGPGWAAGERQWAEILGDDTGELLGVAVVRVGSGPPSAVADPGEPWAADPAVVGGCTLWELPPYDEHDRARRTILALAPADREAELGALVWSDRSPATPPLARHLLEAARLRYEVRVRLAAEPEVRAGASAGAGDRLTELITRLDDLRLTVAITRDNLGTILGTDAGGLLLDDRETAAWLAQTVEDDLRYLANARERARRAAAPPSPAGAVIGIIAAMPEEYDAMLALLDDVTERSVEGDSAVYAVGTVPSTDAGRPHPVVLTMLGATANHDAAAGVAHLLRSFTTVERVLMVGIAAGVPAPDRPAQHVRLGDIVVGTWGVVDYDHVVDRPGGAEPRMGQPRPDYLLERRAKVLEAAALRGERPWEAELDRLIAARPAFARPDPAADVLWSSDDPDAGPVAHPDPAVSGHRPGRPKVHHGRIGSGNRSVRNARLRDELAERYQIRALEMEGAGVVWAAFASGRDCLVVRGVSDYADSRMAMGWRGYAAAVAAAYARALLGRCDPVRR
ncbi:CATRA conflict system CASPASE/TPR repeat-associated protein [Dactylosporangium sp. CA-233914]|uniref:CATRA conflict system CASPASE/TPR repeat-associated protein n=1 Tax=Dactylosporangium sp. CA-233914 TaxID=3239934 RepID=UPI003D8CAD99